MSQNKIAGGLALPLFWLHATIPGTRPARRGERRFDLDIPARTHAGFTCDPTRCDHLGRLDAAMSIERRFDVSLIAGLALREKQIQQSYRPIIGVHKWFARRPGTLFRGLLLAEFGQERLEDLFFRSNDFTGIRIADPFMGGGTPLIEANRVGCDVEGFDINPMSAWIVREEIETLDVASYERAAYARSSSACAPKSVGTTGLRARSTALRTCP